MNLRNKKLVIGVQILLGAFIIFSGVSGLMMGATPEGIPEVMIKINEIYWGTGIIQLAKSIEIIAGLLILSNLRPALGALMLFPMLIGVMVLNTLVTPEYLIFAGTIFVLNLYLIYVYWDKFKGLLEK